MLVTQISIDLSGLSRYEYVIAKQADENSRLIQVQLLDNGKIYVLDDLTTARVSITKPDKKEVLKDCTINNNMVEIALDANILAVAGTAEAEIILTGSGGAITSAAFDIKITATVTGKKAGSSNDYESFKAALAAADAFKNEIKGKATKEELAVERVRIDNLLLDSTVNLSGYELIEIYANSDYSGSTVLEDIWSTSMLLSTTESDAVDWSHAEDVKIINVGAINWNEGASYPDPELHKTLPYYHMDDMSAAIKMIDDAYAVSIMADDTTKTYNRLYVKIVLAYKSHLSIHELEDLKVGTDGMIYDSAGAAVRAQVGQLSEKIEILNEGGLNLKDEFISDQVNDWLSEHPEATATVQDGAITKAKLSDTLLGGLCVNALLLGFVPNDAEYDNSPLLQLWLDSLKKDSPALYFPAGIYYFKTPVVLNKSGVGCVIKGDSAPRDLVYISTVTGLPNALNSSVLFFDIGNSTFITQVSNSPITCRNITFFSDTFKWTFNHADWNTRPTIPYNVFTYEIEEGDENCNAIDVSTYQHCSFVDCLFYGFSGDAVKTTKQNTFNNCKITNCGTGIHTMGHDCTLYGVYISNCVNGILHEGATIFAWNLWIDCCAKYAIKAANNLNGIIDGIIDHINYSAIYAKTSVHLLVRGRINRCGMYYCGAESLDELKDDDLDVQFENYSKASTISIRNCQNSTFDIEAVNRGIADEGEQKYYTPNVMFNYVTWKQNAVNVPSDNIAVHSFWFPDSNARVAHTHDGIHVDGKNKVNETLGTLYTGDVTVVETKEELLTAENGITYFSVVEDELFGTTNGTSLKFETENNGIVLAYSEKGILNISAKKNGNWTGWCMIEGQVPITIRSFASNLLTPQVKGTSVKFTVTASGGKGELQYRFRRISDSGEETVFREYSVSNSAHADPRTTGTYTIYVDVKDEYENVITTSLEYTWTEAE